MKMLAMVALLLLAGCATVERQLAPSFGDAVLASLQTHGKLQDVVLTIGKDGSLAIGGRSIQMGELKTIRSVSGLPENPPGVLIRAHREATHADVMAVMDELSKAGIWRIAFQTINEDELRNQKPQDTARKLTDPEH